MTNLFEFVHHFDQFRRVHVFVHLLEHFVHLFHIFHHYTLRIGLLNLNERSDATNVQWRIRRSSYLGDDAVDPRGHDQKLIMRCSMLNGRFRVDPRRFHVAGFFQRIGRPFPTGLVLFLGRRRFFFDHFLRETKVEFGVRAHIASRVMRK